MPALPPAPGVLRTQINFTLQSDNTALSRIFIKYTGTAPTPAQAAAFAVAVGTAWNTNMSSLMNSSYFQTGVAIEDLSSATGAIGSDSTQHAGTRAGNTLPASACLMVQFLIARRYRGGKPKIFLPLGMSQDLATGPQWSGTFLGAVQTGWNAFIAAVIAAGWTGAGTLSQVNVSYFSGFTVVTNPITHRARNVPTLRGTPTVDPVLSPAFEIGVASQRRRNLV